MDKKQLLSDDLSSDSDSISDADSETAKEIEGDSPDLNDTHQISTIEEDNSGGSAGAAPAPPEKRIKKSQKSQNVRKTTPQLTQGQDKIGMTKPAEQSPQEASLREQMGLAHRVFLQAIAAVGAPMEARYRDTLVDSFQAVTNVATQLLEENAFLRGRLEQPEPLSTVNTTRNENATPKAALPVYPTKPKKNEEHRQVVQALRSAFTPTDIGLEAPRGKSAHTILSSMLHIWTRGREVLGETMCTECGSEHRGTECSQSGERRCLAYEERLRPQDGDDKPSHSALDPACPTYLWHIERLKQKINCL
ncbi:hypothetical protein HPB47_019284 [Ixodes persulcatus]|uniref:Uncharacterized protein n=1 Tax=Ixodes persulcatus TaxID=34615 RepID=A0AC60QKG4_IXOPE|nr:hypothetical protein HPB47_019284 [Ixodes persulcatus]